MTVAGKEDREAHELGYRSESHVYDDEMFLRKHPDFDQWVGVLKTVVSACLQVKAGGKVVHLSAEEAYHMVFVKRCDDCRRVLEETIDREMHCGPMNELVWAAGWRIIRRIGYYPTPPLGL